AMADYMVVPAEKGIPIPKGLSLRDARLSEPVAVGVRGVKRADVLLNKNIVILGAGMIGLSILVNAVKAGAKNIIVIDLIPERLDMAKELGATKILKTNEINIKEKIKEVAPYEGIDVVFECVGIEKTIRDAIEIVRKGGKIIVVGVFGEETKVQMAYVQDRELEILGSLMYIRRDFTEAVEMLARNEFPTEKFISRIFPLEEGQKAFEAAFNKEKNIKIVFEINPE
ncbi:MAG: zinc-binding dehydrogenase, partial [Kosmotogaceae bacterium]